MESFMSGMLLFYKISLTYRFTEKKSNDIFKYSCQNMLCAKILPQLPASRRYHICLHYFWLPKIFNNFPIKFELLSKKSTQVGLGREIEAKHFAGKNGERVKVVDLSYSG